MSRLSNCFATLASNNRKALVPYIVAGDPSLEATVDMMHALVEQGADIIELGVPFSDPMAEGPVIQLGHERALENKVGLRDVLAQVKKFREQNNETPIVLMGYANPIEYMGYETFAAAANEAGVDGILTVDLPPEESDDLNQELKKYAIDNIFLIAPTTSEKRIETIGKLASGYIYYVSLKGVTGAGHLDVAAVNEKLKLIKQYINLPVTVGFGIKDAQSAKAVADISEGAVVGSALVNSWHEYVVDGDSNAEAINKAVTLIGDMRQAMDS